MRSRQDLGDRHREVDHCVGIKRATLHAVRERDALDELGRDPPPATIEHPALVDGILREALDMKAVRRILSPGRKRGWRVIDVLEEDTGSLGPQAAR